MELRSYREQQGWTLQDVAGWIGVANATVVQRHETGKYVPRPYLIEKYKKLTNGAVTAEDFLAANKRWRKAKARELVAA
jgi:DNA-binding XRE family transcriptional regulator